jgi:hypothetical protein
MNNNPFSTTSLEDNPYLSVIYTDGELLQLKKRFLLEREDFINTAEGKSDPLIPLHLSHIHSLTLEVDKITNALESNGASRQTYFDIE